MMIALFWISSAILLYTFAGYPLLLKVLVIWRGSRSINRSPIEPTVSIIVAAHNEEGRVGRRIENLLALDYPREKLAIIIASDGSTDSTAQIASAYKGEGVVVLPLARGGRAVCHNEAVKIAHGAILVFTDADTLFDRRFLRRAVSNFADSSVGVVTGRLKYRNEDDATIARHIGYYWRYELILRALESDAGCLLVSSGCCTALRRHLYQPMNPDEDADNVQPIESVLHGHRVVYDSEAIAYDTPPGTIQGEVQARIRMTVKFLTALARRWQILNLGRYRLNSLAILSHRLLRYLTPVFLISLLLSNVLLASASFFPLTLVVQLGFYGLGAMSIMLNRCGIRLSYVSFAGSFGLANFGFMIGIWRFAIGERVGAYTSVD